MRNDILNRLYLVLVVLPLIVSDDVLVPLLFLLFLCFLPLIVPFIVSDDVLLVDVFCAKRAVADIIERLRAAIMIFFILGYLLNNQLSESTGCPH